MNNNYLRNFYLSSSYFSFYRVELDIRYINSIEEIIEKVRKDLLNTLEKYNFVYLIDQCKNCDFHIHSHTYEEILIANRNDEIYICEGCEDH